MCISNIRILLSTMEIDYCLNFMASSNRLILKIMDGVQLNVNIMNQELTNVLRDRRDSDFRFRHGLTTPASFMLLWVIDNNCILDPSLQSFLDRFQETSYIRIPVFQFFLYFHTLQYYEYIFSVFLLRLLRIPFISYCIQPTNLRHLLNQFRATSVITFQFISLPWYRQLLQYRLLSKTLTIKQHFTILPGHATRMEQQETVRPIEFWWGKKLL
jgi:hypothetical protein